MFATARTFLSNFKVPCLYVALAVGLVAGPAGCYAGKRWMAGEVAEAQLETSRAQTALSDYRASVATATSAALTIGFQEQTAAADAVRSMGDLIVSTIQNGFARVDNAVRTNTDAFRSATNASEYGCLDLPLPESALGVYRRPGGSATPAPGNSSTGLPAATR